MGLTDHGLLWFCFGSFLFNDPSVITSSSWPRSVAGVIEWMVVVVEWCFLFFFCSPSWPYWTLCCLLRSDGCRWAGVFAQVVSGGSVRWDSWQRVVRGLPGKRDEQKGRSSRGGARRGGAASPGKSAGHPAGPQIHQDWPEPLFHPRQPQVRRLKTGEPLKWTLWSWLCRCRTLSPTPAPLCVAMPPMSCAGVGSWTYCWARRAAAVRWTCCATCTIPPPTWACVSSPTLTTTGSACTSSNTCRQAILHTPSLETHCCCGEPQVEHLPCRRRCQTFQWGSSTLTSPKKSLILLTRWGNTALVLILVLPDR